MKRIFLAALLGAIAMFIWTAIAHMLLPLGEAGTAEIPHEETVLATLQHNIGERSGLYLFPGFGLGPDATRAERNEAMKHMDEMVAKNPSGLLIYFPAGGRPMMMGRWLGIEFATELAEAFLVLFLLSFTRLTTFVGRLGFVTIAGVLAAIATNVSYWNWYGFPAAYTASYIFVQIVGFICLGVVASLILKNRAPQVMA
jgi:hypothetical protein